MKFLVVRLNAIGDIVLTSPVIRCIKKQVPLAEVHYLLDPQYYRVMEHNPYVDKIHMHRPGEKMDNLLSEKFDLVIDLQNNDESQGLTKLLGTTTYTVDKLAFQKFIYTKLKWNIMPADHVVDRYFKALSPLGVKNDGEGLDFIIPENEKLVEKDIPASHHLGFIAIVIGGSRRNKKMPVPKLQELCHSIDHPLILLGGKEDFNEGYQVSSIDPIKIYNACGKFSLNESADLLQRSKLVISHDTGLMHIAAALRKPVIAVWGSTVPSLGMYPYYGSVNQNKNLVTENVQYKKLWCRPCTTTGLDHCPQGHFKCMKKIPVQEMVEKVNAILKKGQNSNSLTEGW
ncbi:MAG TPA: glycosyltransferase family 9 protein [Flavisolibacter sp.]